MLAVYVSGHGYGHSTRTAEVLRALRERASALKITICTSAPSFLFEGVVGPPLAVRVVECDVGLVQQDALTIDEAGTADAVRRFLAGWDVLVSREARWLRESGARLVLGDIPPLAFAAAAEAGVPSIALGNFSWDWIYAHLAARQPSLAEASAHAAQAYARAGLLLRLPFAGDLSAFPRIEDVPLVARAPELAKTESRRRLGLDARPVVLLSFGGVGMPGLDPAVFGRLDAYLFLLTGQAGGGAAPNVRRLAAGDLSAAGLYYPDLVAAADVVVSKPGYGIVTDCIGARTRLIYTDRGDFPEYPVLVSEMRRYLPVAFVSNADIRTGRLDDALLQVMGLPLPEPPPTNGAAVAADKIVTALQAASRATSAARREDVEARHYVLTVERVLGPQLSHLGQGPVDGCPLPPRVDHPDESSAGLEVLAHLVQHAPGAVARRQHLDDRSGARLGKSLGGCSF